MVYLVYFLALIFILLGFLLGISLGRNFVFSRKEAGMLLIVTENESAPPCMFLDVTVPFEKLEHSDYVLLKVKPVRTREKQPI